MVPSNEYSILLSDFLLMKEQMAKPTFKIGDLVSPAGNRLDHLFKILGIGIVIDERNDYVRNLCGNESPDHCVVQVRVFWSKPQRTYPCFWYEIMKIG